MVLSRSIVQKLHLLQWSNLPWLRSDTKVQVRVSYSETRDTRCWMPHRISEIVITVQHDQSMTLEQLRQSLLMHAVGPVLQDHGASQLCDAATQIFVRISSGRYSCAFADSEQIQPNGDIGVVPSEKPSGHSGSKRAVDLYADWTATGGAVWGKSVHHVRR